MYNTKQETYQINLNDIVYHTDIYNGQEPLTIIGLRLHEVEVAYDPSGGTQPQKTVKWIPRNGLSKTKQSTDIKDNQISLLKEEIEIIHIFLDTRNIPRKSQENITYSLVGRIKKLEEKYLKVLSKIESECLKNNTIIFNNEIDWDKI